MKLIILIVVVHILISQVCCLTRLNTTSDCSEAGYINIDKKILKLTGLGPNGRKFPTNQKELKKFCLETHKLVNEVETFINNCFQDNIKSLTKVFFFTIKSIERKFCRRKMTKKLSALLSAAPCANEYLRPNMTCLDNYTKTLDKIVHLPSMYNSKKLNYACW